jgi:hypothetical protein
LDILTKITDSRVASHSHASGIRDDVAGYDFEEGGLPRTIPSNDCNAIAHASGEADSAEKFMVGI